MMGVKRQVLLGLVAVLLLQSCSHHKAATVKDLSHSKSKTRHTTHNNKRPSKDAVIVKKGDTLYSIGFANNVDYKKLATLNNIRPPYRIFPGQKIQLTGIVTVLQKKPSTKPSATQNPKTNTPSSKPAVATVATPQPTTTKTPQSTSNNNPVSTTVTKPVTSTTAQPIVANTPPPVANSTWVWPLKGTILSSFSATDTSRKGIKIATKFGQPVHASNHGTVVYSGDGLRGYGELIIIKHSDNLLSAYAHNSKRLVTEGDTVKQGQVIANSGSGNDGKSMLHFEIRKDGQPVNPLQYLPK